VAWEERERGGSYYTRSRRVEGRVVREYVGTGYVAELAARLDRARREEAAAERDRQRYELENLQSLAAPVLELDHAAAILARAHLIAAGCRRHKGEWRRARSA
jgi:hypothetical protein